jgi:hypothetical protein
MKIPTIKSIALTTLVLLLTAVIFSCQKDSRPDTAPTITEEEATVYSDESTQAEASFDDVEDIGMIAAEEESDASAPNGRLSTTLDVRIPPTFEELRRRISNCATITVTPNDNTYPKTITIDFGDGCIGVDGKLRKGAIIIHLTGPVRRSGSVMTITFRNFYHNRALIEGTKIISNMSENGNHKFTVQVKDGKVTFPGGRGYSYEGMKHIKQVEGSDTRIRRDDVYSIEGRSRTEFSNGVTIALNTETPLTKKAACHWISAGTLKIKINERILFLDYGAPDNASCDNKALLTWDNGNKSRLIILR